MEPRQAMHFSLKLEMHQSLHTGRQELDYFIKNINHKYEVISYSNGEVVEANSANDPTDNVPKKMNSYPSSNPDQIRIIAISDTHQRESALGILPPCDILIHSGDILMEGRCISSTKARQKYQQFNQWLGSQPATHKIVIGGNHDCILDGMPKEEAEGLFSNGTYLCNSGMEVMGLYIWASPSSQGGSENRAFQSKTFYNQATEALHALNDSKQAIDILVTHSTCKELQHIAQPRLMHVSGHYHAHHGVYLNEHTNEKASANPSKLLSVCAPIMDHKYRPQNMPIILDIK